MGNEIAYILFLSTLLLVWAFYSWLYWPYRVDKTRQRLFFIRNEIFDYAADGNVDFNHPGYWHLRELVNGMIRFTHKFEFISLLCLYVSLRKALLQSGRFENMMSDIEALPEDVQKQLKNYIYQVNMVMVSHLIQSSIILMGIAFMFRVIFSVKKGWVNSWKIVKEKFPCMHEIDAMTMELS